MSATPIAIRKTPEQRPARAVPPIRLREIDFNVTNYCNLECLHCSYSSTRSKHEPSVDGDVVRRVLDEAAGMGVQVVHWSGGEPATRHDMVDLVRYATDLGFGMRLLSNGLLLSPDRLDRFWEAGLRKVLVSVDGLDEHHDEHRASEGSFRRAMQGARNAVARGFHTRVNAAATVENVDDMVPLAQMLAAEGVDTFTVFYLISVGRGADIVSRQVPPARWRRLMHELSAVARTLPSSMELTVEKVFWFDDEWHDSELRAEGRGGGCLGFLNGCDYVNILADGRVYPCVCFIDHAPALGNIHERSLEDLLNDPASWSFYWSMTEMNATCGTCSMVGPCGGGSRAASKTERGDWFALDPRCGGDPVAQGYVPVCFMLREDLTTKLRSGFAEPLASTVAPTRSALGAPVGSPVEAPVGPPASTPLPAPR